MQKKLICGLMAAAMVFSSVGVVSAESISRTMDSERSRQPSQQGSNDFSRPGDQTNRDMLMPRKFSNALDSAVQGLERASRQTDSELTYRTIQRLLEEEHNLRSLIQMYRSALDR